MLGEFGNYAAIQELTQKVDQQEAQIRELMTLVRQLSAHVDFKLTTQHPALNTNPNSWLCIKVDSDETIWKRVGDGLCLTNTIRTTSPAISASILYGPSSAFSYYRGLVEFLCDLKQPHEWCTPEKYDQIAGRGNAEVRLDFRINESDRLQRESPSQRHNRMLREAACFNKHLPLDSAGSADPVVFPEVPRV